MRFIGQKESAWEIPQPIQTMHEEYSVGVKQNALNELIELKCKMP